jgi:uncharacterized protein YkwD
LILALLAGFAVAARPADAAPADFYSWAKWRLGHSPYTCQAGASWVRPNIRQRVPGSWWARLDGYRAAACPETSNPPAEPPTDPAAGQPADTPVEPPVEPPAEPTAAVRLDARQEALRAAVNAERSRSGLAALGVDAGLQRASQGHTEDMVQFHYFGHDWHDGTPFGTWVSRYTSCHTTGEILAWRSPQQTPGNAVQQWLGSPGHRAALLSSSWSVMGVELTQRNATVEFGRNC